MQIKSCLKTQGLLNVIHYTVYLFISNIGTGSPGGRQRQAERPKSRRVNYQQNELFHPQRRHHRRASPALCGLGARPQRPLTLPLSRSLPVGQVSRFSLSLSLSFCPLPGVSGSLCFFISFSLSSSLPQFPLSRSGCFSPSWASVAHLSPSAGGTETWSHAGWMRDAAWGSGV